MLMVFSLFLTSQKKTVLTPDPGLRLRVLTKGTAAATATADIFSTATVLQNRSHFRRNYSCGFCSTTTKTVVIFQSRSAFLQP